MSDKLQEIKAEVKRKDQSSEANTFYSVGKMLNDMKWLIEQLEKAQIALHTHESYNKTVCELQAELRQAQAANQKLLELFQQKIDTLDERIETRKGPNYFDESKQIEKFNIEAHTWEKALALAKKTLIDDVLKM